MSGPEIPERHSSLFSRSRRNRLDDILKRKTSVASMASSTSSISDFVGSKIDDVSLNIEYADEMRKGLKEALEDGNLHAQQYKEAIEDVEKYKKPKGREIVILKRQKKLIKDDLDEALPLHTKLEDAYANILMNKVMAATAKSKKNKYDQSVFKKLVFAYYGAERDSLDDGKIDESWCHLTGWHPARNIKTAHIVPKSLESSELSYLFGAGEVMLSDVTNGVVVRTIPGLTLHDNIEEALDSGAIVLIPLPPVKGESTKWKCVLTDKGIKNRTLFSVMKWKDIDGRQLEFLTANRPARRYLYFRYIITYLQHKKAGTLEGWVKDVEVKGTMWATPGPYLRQSMLLTLARRVSDHILPKALYEQTTFEEVEEDESVARPKEEDGMVAALALALEEEKEAVVEKRRRMEERESDSDDDDDDE